MTSRRRHLGSLVVLLAAATLRCGGDNVSPHTATTIAEAGGDNQAGVVGQALALPLVVLVTDQSGDPVQGVAVQWDAQGAGSVSSGSVATGSDGRASIQRVLGSQPGEETTTATVNGLQGSPVIFVSTVTDGTSPSLAVQTQPSGSAQSGVAFAVQPVIQLRDPNGSDLAQSGLAVTASISSGNGTLGGTLTRTTDAAGEAAFDDLKITGPNGGYTLQFTAPGTIPALSSTITLGGSSGSGVLLTTNPPVSALSGEVFDPAVQPVVEVHDAGGSPVSGAQVTVSATPAGGTLEGSTTATTDAGGVARFLDLGIRGPGSYTLTFTAGTGSVSSAPITVNPLAAEATTGKWSSLVDWDIVPLHMHLLPTGKILAWGKYDTGAQGTMGGRPRLWDPASGPPTGARMIDVDTMLFCSGHAFMADGRLMVSGGHKLDDKGIDVTNIFDPGSESFAAGVLKMAHGRWYPTVTELSDGRMLTMAGRDSAGNVVTTPEIWENDHWVELPGAGALEIPYYPRNFVDPKIPGRIFMAGERIRSRWFDPNLTTSGKRGRWIAGPSHIYARNREYGTAVMYDAGKILYVGGGGDMGWPTPDPKASVPTATAEKIDLAAASPTWTTAGSMSAPRRHLNSTVLPDGTVLVTGGTRGGGFVDINPADAVREAELWDPKNPTQWTTLAANSVMRVYHSVSLLMPDGTVLHGASGNALAGSSTVPDENNHEIFSPPYLFKGARPTITTAPATVGYNQHFTVATPNAAQITDVRWIRIGSVTHAFDAGQRANTLVFAPTSTGVDVTTPLDARVAPPGFYQLFILNRNGVPSAGKMVRIQ